jgi:hypothetical protein
MLTSLRPLLGVPQLQLPLQVLGSLDPAGAHNAGTVMTNAAEGRT